MNKLFWGLLFCGSFLLTPLVFAQDPDYSSSPSTDDIVDKSTNLMMKEITENMTLTQGQISAIQPIIKDNIAKVRDLQLSLENGGIDSKVMYTQKEQAINDENQKLSLILTPDQMKVWINIQSE